MHYHLLPLSLLTTVIPVNTMKVCGRMEEQRQLIFNPGTTLGGGPWWHSG